MKLYDSTMAPNPRRVRIFLAEKGVTVPTVQVDLGKAENRQPPFLAKNPLGGRAGPRARRRHAASRRASRSAATSRSCTRSRRSSAATRATRRWSRCGSGAWSSRCSRTSRACSRTRTRSSRAASSRCPSSARSAARGAAKRLAWLDEELAGRPFVAGDRYTIADITALCGVDFGRVVNIRPEPSQKNLRALARSGVEPPEREGLSGSGSGSSSATEPDAIGCGAYSCPSSQPGSRLACSSHERAMSSSSTTEPAPSLIASQSRLTAALPPGARLELVVDRELQHGAGWIARDRRRPARCGSRSCAGGRRARGAREVRLLARAPFAGGGQRRALRARLARGRRRAPRGGAEADRARPARARRFERRFYEELAPAASAPRARRSSRAGRCPGARDGWVLLEPLPERGRPVAYGRAPPRARGGPRARPRALPRPRARVAAAARSRGDAPRGPRPRRGGRRPPARAPGAHAGAPLPRERGACSRPRCASRAIRSRSCAPPRSRPRR